MKERYLKNIGNFISIETQQILLNKTFTIIGCGGNGEYFADFLVRLGIKKLILFDGDNFELSNINRQIFYKKNKNKANETALKLKEINPDINIEYYDVFFEDKYINVLLSSDMIIYCADYLYPFKDAFIKVLNKKIPILFQGIGDFGPIGKIFCSENECELIQFINKNKYHLREKTSISQPAFLCALSAAISCVEIIKFYSNKNYQNNSWFHYNIFQEFNND